MTEYVLRFDEVSLGDIEKVGGKNASLGEMIGSLTDVGVSVPMGFATTADAFREFLSYANTSRTACSTLSIPTMFRWVSC